MHEVKKPRKNITYYYFVVLMLIMLFNAFVYPYLLEQQVEEVDYGTFMSMTEKGKIGQVEIQTNQIIFTNKDNSKIYKTGLMDDPDRTQRLYDSGAKFSSEIVQQMSPLASFLMTWILPIVIFVALGQYMSKKMMGKNGGNSMIFGMGSG